MIRRNIETFTWISTYSCHRSEEDLMGSGKDDQDARQHDRC